MKRNIRLAGSETNQINEFKKEVEIVLNKIVEELISQNDRYEKLTSDLIELAKAVHGITEIMKDGMKKSKEKTKNEH